MQCPNDNIKMHPVRLESHYGLRVDLDQCALCGGIWFDKSELHRIKQGETKKIDLLDSRIFREITHIKREKLLCPRDNSKLVKFEDRYFLKDIILVRCTACDGQWLNRGEFTKYQKARQESPKPKEKNAEDKIFDARIERILARHSTRGAADVMGKVGKFLSTPITRYPIGTPLSALYGASVSERQELNYTTNIIVAILSSVIRKRP